MKLPSILCCTYLALTGLLRAQDSTTLVQFDDFLVGGDSVPIPNGYNGLQWDNFGAFNGLSRPSTEGYRTGVISHPNIAFNHFGEPAAISKSTPFTLKSAYLTAAFVDGLPIEIRGWKGTTMAYNNTYILRIGGPTLIQFNYVNVDRVTFTTGNWFVMDDLVIGTGGGDLSLPARGGSISALPGATYDTLYSPAVNGLGHFAFRARFIGPGVTSASDTAIFRFSEASAIDAREGDPAPGADAPFVRFGDPVINSNGAVAFAASLAPTDFFRSSNYRGVWTTLRGQLKLAVREGDAAPGLPAGSRFRNPDWFNLTDSRLYIGAKANIGVALRSGVWAWDGDALTKVLAAGDSIDLSGASRIVKSIAPPTGVETGSAQSRVAALTGKLVLLVNCTDGHSEYVRFF